MKIKISKIVHAVGRVQEKRETIHKICEKVKFVSMKSLIKRINFRSSSLEGSK